MQCAMCESTCKELLMCWSVKPWAELELYGHAPCYRSSWTTSQILPSTNNESSCLLQLLWLPSIHNLQPSCLYQLKTLWKERHIGLRRIQHGWSSIFGNIDRSAVTEATSRMWHSRLQQKHLEPHTTMGAHKTAKHLRSKWQTVGTANNSSLVVAYTSIAAQSHLSSYYHLQRHHIWDPLG